jgi:hypothetical protein
VNIRIKTLSTQKPENMIESTSYVWKTSIIIAGLAGISLLAACATDEPRKETVITVADVDFLSPGVISIIQTSGMVDLNNDPRIVCQKRAPTGSNIPKMLCMTRDEKKIMEDQADRQLAHIQDEWERKYDVYTGTQ